MIAKKDCTEWFKDPLKNPLTGRKINPDAPTGIYQKLLKLCGQPIPPKIIKKKLLDHQKEVVNYISNPRNRSILIVHGTGSGKTLTALASVMRLLKEKPNSQVMIFAPLSTLGNWKRELSQNWKKINWDQFHFLTHQALFFSPVRYLQEICKNAIVVVDEVHNLRGIVSEHKKYLNITGVNSFLKTGEYKGV